MRFLINCGYPPPLLIRSGHTTHLMSPDPAPALGMWELGSDGHGTHTSSFRPGDTLLLYTDGVVEARDSSRTFYPLEQRVALWTRSSPRALVQRIEQDLCAHADGALGDDAALLAIQRIPHRAPGSTSATWSTPKALTTPATRPDHRPDHGTGRPDHEPPRQVSSR
ncbi:PP2C family protein-serine/threonine phosphatase [Streptomyces sp. NPDC058440]|uniref:PP2C family protein-serine/threonine phosphatase n=1 Tax=Streptomyces sp. NPDC058440 TaxID=3346501 RepID=UPI00365C09D6